VYLAQIGSRGARRYLIRESVRTAHGYGFRDLCDLGAEPQRFIVYPGGNAFYIDPLVEDEIAARGGRPGSAELEAIFWPFLDPELSRKLEPYRCRENRLRGDRAPQGRPAGAEAHVFDRRRVLALKSGRRDFSGAVRIPDSAARRLHGKSRDEIEQGFIVQEAELRPREVKAYVFAIFDLQQFFHQGFARSRPEWLEPERLDAFFIDAACRLNRDAGFWMGMDPGDRLHDYLVRYLCMYFDHDFAPRPFADDFLRDFMNRHRGYRPPPSVAVSMEEAAGLFGKSRGELQAMNRADLARQYRRRAQELHPDKGGDHERFVKLTEAYHRLLGAKR
jgi:hypothetical protein